MLFSIYVSNASKVESIGAGHMNGLDTDLTLFGTTVVHSRRLYASFQFQLPDLVATYAGNRITRLFEPYAHNGLNISYLFAEVQWIP